MKTRQDKAYQLKLHPVPPLSLFPEEEFECAVELVPTPAPGFSCPVQVELLTATRGASVHLESPLVIKGGKAATAKIKLKQVAVGTSCKLRFSAQSSPPVLPFETLDIQIVSLKLSAIFCNNHQDREGECLNWYKDESGLESKFIKLAVSVVGPNGSPGPESLLQRQREDFPLQMTLLYDAGSVESSNTSVVQNQSILKLCPDSEDRVYLGAGPGRDITLGGPNQSNRPALMRFRIEHVSRSHQNKKFRVRVEVKGKAGVGGDVGAAMSGPIHVLSKKNRKFKRSDPTGPSLSPRLSHLPSQPNLSLTPISAVATPLGSPKTSPLGLTMPMSLPLPLSLSAKRHCTGTDPLTEIESWCMTAGETFRHVEWGLVAYEAPDPNGQYQMQPRPIYRCPSCWAYKDALKGGMHTSECAVSGMLGRLSQVQESLQALRRSTSSTSGTTTVGSMFPPLSIANHTNQSSLSQTQGPNSAFMPAKGSPPPMPSSAKLERTGSSSGSPPAPSIPVTTLDELMPGIGFARSTSALNTDFNRSSSTSLDFLRSGSAMFEGIARSISSSAFSDMPKMGPIEFMRGYSASSVAPLSTLAPFPMFDLEPTEMTHNELTQEAGIELMESIFYTIAQRHGAGFPCFNQDRRFVCFLISIDTTPSGMQLTLPGPDTQPPVLENLLRDLLSRGSPLVRLRGSASARKMLEDTILSTIHRGS